MKINQFEFNNLYAFQIRIRNKHGLWLDYPGGRIFPCNIYSKRTGIYALEKDAFYIKDWLIGLGHSILVVTNDNRVGYLRRREVSHIDGPFEIDEMKRISKMEASIRWGISLRTINKFREFNEEATIPYNLVQKYFGAHGGIPDKEKYRYTSIVRDLRENGHSGTEYWGEDEAEIKKEELIAFDIYMSSNH
ncbi:hypothetical protein GCM10010912_29850 [Paenibacillus albidus]|uniref:Uncharacterized protein n=1 Tax=Paenibacillus albidus TaxID=2041023 RepID=A0A917CB21_9BACL|nr:hypothetical protein [Paenibacillus albidus]GGF82762.1 hypothetical protein GCM10010912_29850 [Paenibacillus albidus]